MYQDSQDLWHEIMYLWFEFLLAELSKGHDIPHQVRFHPWQTLHCASAHSEVDQDHKQTAFIQLENNYDDLDVEKLSITAEVRQLDAQLAKCSLLRPQLGLQWEITRAGEVYRQHKLRYGYQEALQSQAIWNGICLWISRRLGPIPQDVVNSSALSRVIKVLKDFCLPKRSCHYSKRRLVRLLFFPDRCYHLILTIFPRDNSLS